MIISLCLVAALLQIIIFIIETKIENEKDTVIVAILNKLSLISASGAVFYVLICL